MNIRGKRSGYIYENVKLVDGKWKNEQGEIVAYEDQVSELHLTAEELQERIEAAVKEHESTKVETLELAHELSLVKQKELRERIAELEEVNNEILQGKYDAQKKLFDANKRVSELEAERKPVEVSEADAAAIEWYKNFNFFWERDMINVTDRESSPHRDTIDEWTYAFVCDVIKRGYTVKLDPIRTDLSTLLQKLNDEQISEKEYLDQLTEYAHGLQSRTEADS